MEDAVVSAATGALGPVLGKLVALLGEKYKRLKNIRTEIQSLQLELRTIDAFLETMADAEDPNPQDKAWMKEVRELSYDVEDILDDFMARVLADDKSAKPDGLMDRIKTSLKSPLKKLMARHEIAKAIEDLKKQATELSERNKRYRDHAIPNTSSSSKIDRRALAIFNDVSKLVGVDGPKQELLQLLADGDGQQQTKLVAIVGFGGLGKTTIANQVYQELKGEFEYHAILSVSRNPDITEVMSNIYSQLDKEYSRGKEELQTLIAKILDFLQNKRYLIVVDDIWKVDDWDFIKCAFPRTNSGSKIITTTRIKDIAESCRSSFSGHIYQLRHLDMMQSRQLLYTRLFNSAEKCPPDLKEIADQILKKCDGLPLAIVAISGVLADKRKKDQWERVKDSIGRALRNYRDGTMVNIISLSYLDLPPYLKTCLLYLSIFPEDYIINKQNLIRRWIGEGFIYKAKEDSRTMYELGEMHFNDLINRSLIQPAGMDGARGDEVKSCRVHDTVHDFIVSKAVDENFVTVIGVAGINYDPQMKVRRLSLQHKGEIPAGLVVSNARSLHVFGPKAKIPPVSQFRLLRVMDFQNCSQLKVHHLVGIGNLLHLKYLRFKHARTLKALPEELARLQELEIDIHGSNRIMKIPETVHRLVRYVALYLDGEVTVPDEIAALQGLRVLEELNVYTQSIKFLEGLGQLEHLRRLSILFYNSDCDDDWEEKMEKAASSVSELGKRELEALRIYVHDGADDLFERVPWFPVPPYGLRELVVDGDTLETIPKWMASLVNLEKLDLAMHKMGEEDVKILGALPSLCYLNIQCNVYFDEGPEMEAAMARAMEAHPNRPTLNWEYE